MSKEKLWCECSKKEQRKFADLHRCYEKLNYVYSKGAISNKSYQYGLDMIEQELNKLEEEFNNR